MPLPTSIFKNEFDNKSRSLYDELQKKWLEQQHEQTEYLFIDGPCDCEERMVEHAEDYVQVKTKTNKTIESNCTYAEREEAIRELLGLPDIKNYVNKKKLGKYDAYLHAALLFDQKIKNSSFSYSLITAANYKKTRMLISEPALGTIVSFYENGYIPRYHPENLDSFFVYLHANTNVATKRSTEEQEYAINLFYKSVIKRQRYYPFNYSREELAVRAMATTYPKKYEPSNYSLMDYTKLI